MKRKVVIAAIALVAFILFGFIAPILISRSQAQPLYGNFDWDAQCMGGHEIFLFLGEREAFEHCPGHHDMDLIGPVDRTATSVTIRSHQTNDPWGRVDLSGDRHTLVFPDDGTAYDLPQVSSPWRTWLPRLFPE